jgi:hypothetical protein
LPVLSCHLLAQIQTLYQYSFHALGIVLFQQNIVFYSVLKHSALTSCATVYPISVTTVQGFVCVCVCVVCICAGLRAWVCLCVCAWGCAHLCVGAHAWLRVCLDIRQLYCCFYTVVLLSPPRDGFLVVCVYCHIPCFLYRHMHKQKLVK